MDIKLIDNGNGGDAIFTGSDLKMIDGWENMPYLGIVGGNVESNTIQVGDGEQSFDWWGNNVFFFSDSSRQFNSDFERLLNNVSITSASRILMQQTVTNDLKFMTDFSGVTVSVTTIGLDRIQVLIQISEPNNLESNEFIYIWDSTKNELVNND